MSTDSLCSSNEGRLFEDELAGESSREVIEALERRVKALEQDVQDEQGAAHKLKEKLVEEQGKTASLEEELKRKEIDCMASVTLLMRAEGLNFKSATSVLSDFHHIRMSCFSHIAHASGAK